MYHLPTLSYSKKDLVPFLTEEQISFHYDKHHKTYIDNLNKFIEADSSLKEKTLEQIVVSSSGPLFNNAAQIWNHTFYWLCLAPKGKNGSPSASLQQAIDKTFGYTAALKEKFVDTGVKTFGSGWAWLCQNEQGSLELVSTSNAQVPFVGNKELKPLLTVDVWEHAYYVDYRNARQKYLETFWDYVNWDFVNENFQAQGVKNLSSLMR